MSSKEIREYRCALVNAMYCKLVSKNLPINVEGKKNHATSCNPCGLVASIAAFHPGDPGSISGRNNILYQQMIMFQPGTEPGTPAILITRPQGLQEVA